MHGIQRSQRSRTSRSRTNGRTPFSSPLSICLCVYLSIYVCMYTYIYIYIFMHTIYLYVYVNTYKHTNKASGAGCGARARLSAGSSLKPLTLGRMGVRDPEVVASVWGHRLGTVIRVTLVFSLCLSVSVSLYFFLSVCPSVCLSFYQEWVDAILCSSEVFRVIVSELSSGSIPPKT